jgi:pSer/pThr/pTyr-binding forkhead associated (FHA) protein
MSEKKVNILKGNKLPTEAGKYYRLLCLTGKHKGLSFFIMSNRVVLGRSESADIQVIDGKSSREHAELVMVDGKYVLTDLGSQNGVVINDLKVNQHTLKDGEKIIIGKTVYKYNVIEVKGMDVISQVDGEIEEYDEDDEDYDEDSTKGSSKRGPAKKSKLIPILIILVGVFFAIPDEKKKAPKKRKPRRLGSSGEDIFEKKIKESQLLEDKESRQKLNALIHRGRREYREQNYFRAIEQFNLALILDPSNGTAGYLLNKTKQRLDEQIQAMFNKAKQETEALKFSGAIKQYCSIISYLQDYPEDKRYIAAEANIETLEERIGLDKGEYKCF